MKQVPELEHPVRYSVIGEKNKREIVMLRGKGCAWRRCRFCDYHLDSSPDQEANRRLNRRELDRVRGLYGVLEVINSGSFVDLDEGTMEAIRGTCLERGIRQIHFECHWMHRGEVPALRRFFGEAGIAVKVKIGVETFDAAYREEILVKGIDERDPAAIAAVFDECCLLQGLPGQTAESMGWDIETGLAHFQRVCVNLMVENGMPVRPDPEAVRAFVEEVHPKYRENPRVDILLENTDFGVGGEQEYAQ